MSHLNSDLLRLITLAEQDAHRLSTYRRDYNKLSPEQLRHSASLGNGLGMQFDHLARCANEAGATAHAAMWRSEATKFFDAAAIDELNGDLADHARDLEFSG